jgi:hypothetical protein
MNLEDEINKLTAKLQDVSFNHILEMLLEKDLDTKYLLDLILSAHVNSIINTMTTIAETNKQCANNVKIFTDSFIKQLESIAPITSVKKTRLDD